MEIFAAFVYNICLHTFVTSLLSKNYYCRDGPLTFTKQIFQFTSLVKCQHPGFHKAIDKII